MRAPGADPVLDPEPDADLTLVLTLTSARTLTWYQPPDPHSYLLPDTRSIYGFKQWTVTRTIAARGFLIANTLNISRN